MVVVETIRDIVISIVLAVLIPLTLIFGLQAFMDSSAFNYHTLYLAISAIIGGALIIASFFVNISYLSAGILFGGAACIMVGVLNNWHVMNAQLKFFILLGAVIMLVALSYYFFMRGQTINKR